MQAVIMAGGKGSRIASVNSEVPKPMIPIAGKPILEWQIACLKRQGITDIILIIGHLGASICEHFGDGSLFGVNISYIVEATPLGTAGGLFYLKGKIQDDFLLLNGDVVFDIDINRFYSTHKTKGGLSTLFTHPNNHPYDSGIIVSGSDGKVLNWLHKEDSRTWYKNRVNAGLHFLSPRVLDFLTEPQKIDLDRDLFKPMISSGQIYAYDSPEYVRDMGTPDRYYSVERDLQNGIVRTKNLLNKQKAIFLDRDGTINKYKGFLRTLDAFELLAGVADQIKAINEKGYLVIVITNQPVIARGDVSWEELYEIHDKMETLLGEKGAFIDDIFICPHHPHKGFVGERIEYKFDCDCRKPKPGMLLAAAKKYNIDLAKSWMIGDSSSDIEAGKAAGCLTHLVVAGSTNWNLSI